MDPAATISPRASSFDPPRPRLGLRRLLFFILLALAPSAARGSAGGPALTADGLLQPGGATAAGPAAEELVPHSPPPPAVCVRQVWAISSREACCAWGAEPRLGVWRYDDASGQWVVSSREEFLAADDPAVPTSFFVHGNRISHYEAFTAGWHAYRAMAASAPPEQPLRFVIWSWPSTRVQGNLQDVRVKAGVSDAHAYHLAWLVNQMDPAVPISMVGYSYGARLITGSLHLLGGGYVAGQSLPHVAHPDRTPVRAVLMAGALDNTSLAPHGRNGLALGEVDHVLVMVNPADPVLKYYPLLYGLRGGPEAIGYTGAAGAGCWGHEKLVHWNVGPWIGRQHDWSAYVCAPAVMARTSAWAFFAEQ